MIGDEHPEWRRRLRQARDQLIPWIAETVPLAGATVLEYGCGQGAVSCALAPSVGHHIGVDIDADAVDEAREHAARRGLANLTLHAESEASILDRVREHTGAIDVVLLYAVLEHLTIGERLEVLHLAREIVRPDGHIVICEAPNRLTPVDHHTGQMPFLHALPEPLAERYFDRSPRTDFVEAIEAAAVAGGAAARRTALTRWGTGMSYHELELVFDDLEAHTLASSYHPLLYPGRPVLGEELELARLLEAWRPDLPPCWSRSWLDTVLSARPLPAPPVHVRPWTMALDHDVAGAALLADGHVELRPGARLPVRLPAPTDELHVGLLVDGDPSDALEIHTPSDTLTPRAAPSIPEVRQWHTACTLPGDGSRFELSLRTGGCLTYVGYRGAADPAAAASRAKGW